jgi:hypothetical protein
LLQSSRFCQHTIIPYNWCSHNNSVAHHHYILLDLPSIVNINIAIYQPYKLPKPETIVIFFITIKLPGIDLQYMPSSARHQRKPVKRSGLVSITTARDDNREVEAVFGISPVVATIATTTWKEAESGRYHGYAFVLGEMMMTSYCCHKTKPR